MENKGTTPGFRIIFQLLVFVVIIPFLPLLISQQWGWWEAWVYAAVYILGFVISRWMAHTRNPDLIEERAKSTEHEDTEPFDRILAPLVGLGGALIPLVAGLEARWSTLDYFDFATRMGALAIIVGGFAFGSWALLENRFFSGVVRIQSDRGQHVISTGPYAIMRHPGYTGAILTYLGTPVFLDAVWAYLPVLLLIGILVVRTHFEDRTLQEKLDGYRDYAQRVRFRLFPGLW